MKMKRKNLLLSLVFPVIILIAFSLIHIFFVSNYNDFKSDKLAFTFQICLLAGGLLSVLLTVLLSIDTSDLLKFRVIYLLVCSVLYLFIVDATADDKLAIVLPILSCFIGYVCIIGKTYKYEKLIIVILSDPILYFSIAIIFFLISIKLSGGLFSQGI